MILVLERDPAAPSRYRTRVVLEEGEFTPTSMLDVRLALRLALENLPGRVDLLSISHFPNRRKEDK